MIRFQYPLLFVSNCVFRKYILKEISKRNIYSSRCEYFLSNVVLNTNKLVKRSKEEEAEEKRLVLKERIFKEMTVKDKNSFLKVLDAFAEGRGRRGYVEFIYAALRNMEEFNVHTDLETYKKLLDLFPKGKYIPRNMWQADFFHHARENDCALEMMDQMEYNGVSPDQELKELMLNIFGFSSLAYKRFARMMYWMPKMKNKNPYLPLDPLPSDTEELARLALKKMSVDPRTEITHYKTDELPDAIDKTWIVSAQSPVQQNLLVDHSVEKPLYVEGAFLVWLRRLSLSYFILRADPRPPPVVDIDDDDVSNLSLYMFGEPKPESLAIRPNTVHEQEDATIFAMCATGTSSKDSVLSWVHFLKKTNPKLDKIPILFKLKSAPKALTTVNAPVSEEFKDSLDIDENETMDNESSIDKDKPT